MFSREYIICSSFLVAELIFEYFLCWFISSYLVVNTEKRRSLSSLSPHSTSGDAHSHLTAVRKRDILRTFYKTIVGTMINLPSATQSGWLSFFLFLQQIL